MRWRAIRENARVLHAAEGVRGNLDKSLCCGFHGKEQARQDKPI